MAANPHKGEKFVQKNEARCDGGKEKMLGCKKHWERNTTKKEKHHLWRAIKWSPTRNRKSGLISPKNWIRTATASCDPWGKKANKKSTI